jgi:hypothetical protein
MRILFVSISDVLGPYMGIFFKLTPVKHMPNFGETVKTTTNIAAL